MIYSYLATDRIPKQLSEGVVYHNPEFEIGAMLCACGCGLRIDFLVPDSHQIKSDNGLATITPSILVCAGSCRSHYFITAGQVEWANEFTPAQASDIMRRQMARHAMLDKRRLSWIERCRKIIRQFSDWLKRLIHRRS
jgi:hypothetical protein